MPTATDKPRKQKSAGNPAGTLRLQWVRSAICAPGKHKKVIRGLGFTRLNQTIERPNTPDIRGMVATSALSRSCTRASNVALITLCGLAVPRLLVSTF